MCVCVCVCVHVCVLTIASIDNYVFKIYKIMKAKFILKTLSYKNVEKFFLIF